jgi:DNA-binding NarL/FixJ family response regulator
MTSVLIVDDSSLFRRRLRIFLAAQPGLEVVGEAGDVAAALAQAAELQPDIVLMDVRLEGSNGLVATRHLKMQLPHVLVIVLSLYDMEAYRNAARAAGASAYVTKRALMDELLPLIRNLANHTQQLQPE